MENKTIKTAYKLIHKNTDYDRCPMCDTPTPVDSSGRCTCPSCGHSWPAGSH